VKVTKGQGNQLRLVKNGAAQEPVAVDADPFVYTTTVEPPASGEDRWRAEVLVDDKPRTVTSHVWLKLDPSGPAADAPPAEEDGCNASDAAGSRAPTTLLITIAVAFAAAAVRRHRRAGGGSRQMCSEHICSKARPRRS
jgi:hypothetical protein